MSPVDVEMFERISLATRQVFFDINSITGEVEWDGPFESVLGYTAEAMPTQADQWLQWVHAEDQAEVLRQREVAREPYSTYQVTYRFLRMDGAWIWLLERGVAAVEEAAQTVHWSGAVEDISGRKQGERELLQYRYALDRTTDAIFITDINGIIQYVNPAFEKVYGFTFREAVGQNPRILKSGINPPERYVHFWNTLLSKQPVETEIVNKTKDGRLVPVQGLNAPILDSNDEIIGFMAAHRIITEHKPVEEPVDGRQTAAEVLHRSAIPDGGRAVFPQNPVSPVYRFTPNSAIPSEDLWTGQVPGGVESQEPLAEVVGQAIQVKSLLHSQGENPYTAAPLADRDGNVIGALGVYDSPQRPLTEEELNLMEQISEQVALALESSRLFTQTQRSREQLSEALVIASMGYLEVDLVNQNLILSDEYFRLLRTSAEQEGGYQMSVSDFSAKFLQPDDLNAMFTASQAATEAGKDQFEVELQVICKDGEKRWLRTQFSFVKDEQGAPVRMVGAAQDVTERLQTRQALARRAHELSTVASLGTRISAVLDPSQLLQTVVDLVKDSFSLYHAHVYLLGERGDILSLAAGAGEIGRQMVKQGWQIPLDHEQSLVARSARTRQGVIANDVHLERDYMPNELLPKTRSEMAVPLMVGERVLGVLDIQSDEANHFSEEDVAIQTVLASQVAVALQNARTYAQTQQQAEYEALINTISQKIQSTTSVENALQVAVRELGRALGASRTSVQLNLGKKGLKS